MKLVTSIQILRPNIWLRCIIINGFELLVFIQIIYYNILYFSSLSKVCYKIKLKMYSLLIYNGGFFVLYQILLVYTMCREQID